MRDTTATLARSLFPTSEAAFSLPDDVVRARRTVATIEVLLAASRDDPQSPSQVRAKAVQSIVDAADAGQAPVAAEKAVLAAEDAAVLRQTRAGLLADALEQADSRLVAAIVNRADEVLAQHLRPPLETALDEVREVLAAADTVPWTDPRALARASDPIRVAYEVVRAAADRIATLRTAQFQLQRLTGEPAAEAFGVFGTIRNVHDLWPQFGQGYPAVPAPWPKEPAQALVYQLAHGADIWMPTAAEVIDRYEEWRAERRAQVSGAGVAYAGDRQSS
jgi:hypothetical protein